MRGLVLCGWLLIGQALSGLPAMTDGTEVRIVTPDLATVLSIATVHNSRLAFEGQLEPATTIKVVFLLPDSDNSENGTSLSGYNGMVSPEGNDILIYPENSGEAISFRTWLEEERNIRLLIAPPRE